MSNKILGQIVGLAFLGKLPRLEGNKPDYQTLAQMFNITVPQAEHAVCLANGGISQFFKVQK